MIISHILKVVNFIVINKFEISDHLSMHTNLLFCEFLFCVTYWFTCYNKDENAINLLVVNVMLTLRGRKLIMSKIDWQEKALFVTGHCRMRLVPFC